MQTISEALGDGSPLHCPRLDPVFKISLQRADNNTAWFGGHLLDPNTHVSTAVRKAIAPVVARVAAKRADLVAVRVRSICRKDAVDVEMVATVGVDDVVPHDPHIFERKEDTL